MGGKYINEIAPVLKEFKSLTTLNISICIFRILIDNQYIGCDGMIALAPALKELNSLSILFLSKYYFYEHLYLL